MTRLVVLGVLKWSGQKRIISDSCYVFTCCEEQCQEARLIWG